MLSELLTELELRRTDRETGFLTVARKLAAGEKVAIATVEKLLADTGKSPSELAQAVELLKQRLQWCEQRRKGTGLEKEQSAVQARIAAEDRKLEQAENAHTEATSPLYGRLHEIREAVSLASDARRKLIDTCPDPKLKAELADVEHRLSMLHEKEVLLRKRTDLMKQADRDDLTAEMLAEGIVPHAPTGHIDRMREQAARDREAGKQALAELEQVRKELAWLQQQESTVLERMTKP